MTAVARSRPAIFGHRFSPRAAGAFVLLAALLAPLLFILAYPLPTVHDDALGYLELARNVAAGKGFTQNGLTPMVYRPPLFSALLGGWFFLTGTSSLASAAIFQSLVHAAGVLAAFLLFLELAPSVIWAAAGALFLAVNPLLVTRVVFVLQEPTLLLFTTLAAYISVRTIKAPAAPRAALTGAAWGLCTLAKVVAWFVPFVLLAMHFLPGRLGRKWRGKEAAAVLVCFTAIIAPWTIRNYVHFQRFIPVNGQGEGMLEWNVSQAEIPGERPGSEYSVEVYRKGLPEGERKARLWRYVFDHPRYFFGYRVLRNVVHFAAPPRDWWIERGLVPPGERRPWFWILSSLFHIPLYLLLLLRTRQWWAGRATPALGFIVLLYWAYWAEHAITWGDPRFGLAVYPLLVGIAIAGTPANREAALSAAKTPAPGLGTRGVEGEGAQPPG
ncbi:MAG: phospholipid carrier-dependent glycosyltransferase [Deltaproteobacteria bacterium]|nr:MAG: phospholipid carrier-dependent glycosyltransferase [Deltaproteobacteria bacterium]